MLSKTIDFSQFSLLRKTKRALQDFENDNSYDKEKWSAILSKYYPKTGKSKKKVNWKDIADRIFSEFIRIMESDDEGYITCTCCGSKAFWKEAQAMHYRSRDCLKYRFDEMNVHAWCMRCNVILSWNYRNYTLVMINLYGKEMEELIRNDKWLVKLDQEWYMIHIEEWRDKLEFIRKQKKV